MAEKVNDIWRFAIYDVFGKMIAEYGGLNQTDDGGVKFIHQDIQGSTRTVTSLAGNVTARMDYQAFGEQIPNAIGQRTATGFAGNDSIRHRYGLTERDEATGLDDTWWRKHENRAGRWTRPDPYLGSMDIGDPQSFNRYSYVVNEPTNFVDPSGLFIIAITTCRREVTSISYEDDDGTIHISTDEHTVCNTQFIDFGGGGGPTWFPPVEPPGPIGPGPINPPVAPPPGNDCHSFVNTIAEKVEAKINDTTARINIGANFVKGAVDLLDVGKVSVSGFLPNLVAGGQDNDVYRHVYGAAGSYLLDGVGLAELGDSTRQNLANWWDNGARSAERQASIDGNAAGTTAGSLIASRIRGDLTAEKLVEKLRSLLCAK